MLANGQRYFSHSLTMVVCALNEEELIEEFLEKSVAPIPAMAALPESVMRGSPT